MIPIDLFVVICLFVLIAYILQQRAYQKHIEALLKSQELAKKERSELLEMLGYNRLIEDAASDASRTAKPPEKANFGTAYGLKIDKSLTKEGISVFSEET